MVGGPGTAATSLLDEDNNNDAVSSPKVMDIFFIVVKGLREQLVLTFLLVGAAFLASFSFLLILLGG